MNFLQNQTFANETFQNWILFVFLLTFAWAAAASAEAMFHRETNLL